jgi:hypothetical protein
VVLQTLAQAVVLVISLRVETMLELTAGAQAAMVAVAAVLVAEVTSAVMAVTEFFTFITKEKIKWQLLLI